MKLVKRNPIHFANKRNSQSFYLFYFNFIIILADFLQLIFKMIIDKSR